MSVGIVRAIVVVVAIIPRVSLVAVSRGIGVSLIVVVSGVGFVVVISLSGVNVSKWVVGVSRRAGGITLITSRPWATGHVEVVEGRMETKWRL